jgi:hypothetical protein
MTAVFLISSGLFAGDLSVDGSIHGGTRTSGDDNYHSFASGATTPNSTGMGNLGDVLVRWDLEVGANLYVTNRSSGESQGYLEGVNGSPDRIQIVSEDRAAAEDDSEVWIYSRAGVVFVADSDGDTNVVPFKWYNNGLTIGTDLMADLDGSGNLRLKGTLSQNVSFDLAEAFLRGGELEPGEVVSISGSERRTVVKSAGAGDSMVIGVVSTKPGIIMGGGAFSARDLREAWGNDVADLFESERALLESKALSLENGLAERKEMLAAAKSRVSVAAHDENGGYDEAAILMEDSMRFRSDLESRALELFFETHFVHVALAGRVPVKVDTSFGAIRPGDYLTASPVPGAAMKATGPGPIIGTALEGAEGDDVSVLTFVHRGWYGGESMDLTARLQRQEETLAAQQALLAAKDRRIEELSHRLLQLENAVGHLATAAGVNARGIALASAKQ